MESLRTEKKVFCGEFSSVQKHCGQVHSAQKRNGLHGIGEQVVIQHAVDALAAVHQLALVTLVVVCECSSHRLRIKVSRAGCERMTAAETSSIAYKNIKIKQLKTQRIHVPCSAKFRLSSGANRISGCG